MFIELFTFPSNERHLVFEREAIELFEEMRQSWPKIFRKNQ